MQAEIQSAVGDCSTLTLQVNKGERHRIMRGDIGRGSLWITPQSNSYSVAVTGNADPLICEFICEHFGPETRIDQGNKHWNIKNIGDVARIIRKFGSA